MARSSRGYDIGRTATSPDRRTGPDRTGAGGNGCTTGSSEGHGPRRRHAPASTGEDAEGIAELTSSVGGGRRTGADGRELGTGATKTRGGCRSFIVTHRPRKREVAFTSFSESRRPAASVRGGDGRDVHVMGATSSRQALAAGDRDDLTIIVAPRPSAAQASALFDGCSGLARARAARGAPVAVRAFIEYRVKRSDTREMRPDKQFAAVTESPKPGRVDLRGHAGLGRLLRNPRPREGPARSTATRSAARKGDGDGSRTAPFKAAHRKAIGKEAGETVVVRPRRGALRDSVRAATRWYPLQTGWLDARLRSSRWSPGPSSWSLGMRFVTR